MLYQAAVYLIAAVIVVLIIAGVATAFSGSAQKFILKRIGGAIYRAVTEETRGVDQQRAAKIALAADLNRAFSDLSQAVFVRATSGDVEASRIRMLCPDTREAVDSFLNDWHHVTMSPEQIHQKLDAIRDSASKCLDV